MRWDLGFICFYIFELDFGRHTLSLHRETEMGTQNG